MITMAPAGCGGRLRDAPAEEDSRMKGGHTTKIHERIIGEHLSNQWGEPQISDAKPIRAEIGLLQRFGMGQRILFISLE